MDKIQQSLQVAHPGSSTNSKMMSTFLVRKKRFALIAIVCEGVYLINNKREKSEFCIFILGKRKRKKKTCREKMVAKTIKRKRFLLFCFFVFFFPFCYSFFLLFFFSSFITVFVVCGEKKGSNVIERKRETRQTDIQKSCLFLSPQEEWFGCSGITVQSGRGRLMRVTLHINIFKRRRRESWRRLYIGRRRRRRRKESDLTKSSKKGTASRTTTSRRRKRNGIITFCLSVCTNPPSQCPVGDHFEKNFESKLTIGNSAPVVKGFETLSERHAVL